MFVCKFCKSESAVKFGLRKNGSGFVQRYFCSDCGKTFVDRKGFENFRNKSEVITAALDLRAKGVSLADIVDHLDQHHRVKVSRQTILDWQNKFGKKLKSFTQTLKPQIDGDVHADEVFLKVRKDWNYYWDAMDYVTKFIVGEHLSTDRNWREAKEFLAQVKTTTQDKIWRIHTDNSFDYPLPIKLVFGKNIFHQHFPAHKKKFKNNPIERFHNSLKQRYKTFRGFDNTQSAKKFLDFWIVYYNFIRKHTTLGFTTPAQAAKIDLNLGRNRIRSLIESLLKQFNHKHYL